MNTTPLISRFDKITFINLEERAFVSSISLRVKASISSSLAQTKTLTCAQPDGRPQAPVVLNFYSVLLGNQTFNGTSLTGLGHIWPNVPLMLEHVNWTDLQNTF